MFARVHTILALALYVSAASVAVLPRDGSPTTCNANTGTQQCCDSVQSASDNPLISAIAALLGINIASDTQVGVTCSPITVAGSSTTECNSQAVCCNDNSFNGIINIGCSPININL